MGYIKYVVNVEGAIFRDGKYLTIIRGQSEAHASGLLALVGGTVESLGQLNDVLEQNLRREILEEVGLEVGETIFTQANQFTLNPDTEVINIIFLCQYVSGDARIASAEEVEQVLWLSVDEMMAHSLAPIWLIEGIKRVEEVRIKNGW